MTQNNRKAKYFKLEEKDKPNAIQAVKDGKMGINKGSKRLKNTKSYI